MKPAPAMQHPKKTVRSNGSSASVSLLHTNVVRTPEHGGRADVLGQAVERERGDDRAGLAARGGHAVCGRAEARGEDLRGVAVCRPTVAATRLGLAHGAHGGEQRVRGREETYVLAPKLKKNWRKAKHTMNAGVLNL